MARDPDNVKIWSDARVFLAIGDTRPAIPTDVDTAFGTGWEEAGILDGEDGFGEERSQDESEFFGWGIGLIKVGGRNYGLSRTWSPLEDNPVIRGLVWPGSTDTKLALPKPVYRWIAFETDSDFGDRERLIATKRARIWVPDNNRNESDITKWTVQTKLFADGTGDVFDRQIPAVTP
ncbi:hypothetical protein IU438_28860 [Nocardia cyriacigeorgica]|uniref:hypothetical protein n=1 Tax=Nocardia cyriacigeorgica TaxID=135487 RepID=UPI001894CEBA|nr:hypothetical protein [Nocardia cyriacigeorgica]MBF6399784.1 hypothetical protein [Nocardia cyriacigeorgica]MBF6405387.1 hypothetical protein [Nocardia cyriacigeorgica]